jgi:hypothetical protein
LLLLARSKEAASSGARAQLVAEGRRLVPWRHPEVHAALAAHGRRHGRKVVGALPIPGGPAPMNLDWGKPSWQPKVSWPWTKAPPCRAEPAKAGKTTVAVLALPPRKRSLPGRFADCRPKRCR